jgi:hypothetical protein
VCVSPCLCLRRCLCLCFCVCFVYPAQGPGGETSVKARKGHHAHATAGQRLALADACCGSADRARRRRTVRVASVEMGLELEPAGLFTVRNARSQRIVVLIVVLRATYVQQPRSAPPDLSPVGGIQGRASCDRYGLQLCMPVTPVRRRRRKASASRLRTAEDDNRRGPALGAWERLDTDGCAKSTGR